MFKLPWWMKLDWRHTKPLYVLCGIEFPITVACLALFGIADPNTYRTALWTEGSRLGYNSDPIEILYSYANYRPIAVPTPWNQFITDFNVVIVVLSMFILLAKTVMYIIHLLPPMFSTILHGILATFYAISISQQAASDYSDPSHPSKYPWYLTHSCGAPVTPSLQSYCKEAQASFAVSVCMCTLFTTYFFYSLIMAFPTKAQRECAQQERLEDNVDYYGKDYEMASMRTPASPAFGSRTQQQYPPMTPRTMAFNTLDGTAGQRGPNKDLPLRHHIAMGNETFKG